MAIKANFTAGLLSVTGDNGGDDHYGQPRRGRTTFSSTAERYPFRETPTDARQHHRNRCVRRERQRHDLARQRSAARRASAAHRTSVRRQRQRHPQRRRRQRHPRSAATATTRSLAVKATTWRSSAPATTRSSGIRATAMTWSRAAAASTRSTSAAPIDSRRDLQHRSPTAPGRAFNRRQRHHRSQRCRAHSVRGSGPARRQHHDQRSDRNRREAGRHRPGGRRPDGGGDGQVDTVTSTRPTAKRSRSPTTTAWSRCRVWPAP